MTHVDSGYHCFASGGILVGLSEGRLSGTREVFVSLAAERKNGYLVFRVLQRIKCEVQRATYTRGPP